MLKPAHSRRDLLRVLAQGAISLPFLSSLLADAEAAQLQYPKRIILLFSANGQYGPDWYPQGLAPQAQQVLLRSIEGPLSPILGREFDSYRDKMLLLRGLDLIPSVDEHWGSKIFSGYGQTYNRKPTIDQIICRSPQFYAQEPMLRSLVAKVEGKLGSDRLLAATHSYAPLGTDTLTIVPQSSPSSVLAAMFPNLSNSIGSAQVLSELHKQYNRLLSSNRLSAEDRYRLDAHVTFVHEMKQKYRQPQAAVCGSSRSLGDVGEDKSIPTLMRDHMRLIASAIKCDITRVVRLNMTESAESQSYNFIPGVAAGSFHNFTHTFNAASQDHFRLVQQWIAKQVAFLLNELNEVEDPTTGRTYLDNSIVFWGNESGARPNSNPNNVHDDIDIPCLLVGGGAGYLATGQYIDYRRWGMQRQWASNICADSSCINDENHNFIGRPVNELLITLMLAMGLTPSDWEETGIVGFGDYRDNFRDQYQLGDRRSPLPLIVAA